MRNAELAKLDGLIGEWATTLSDAWFLDAGVVVLGTTSIARLGESLLIMRTMLPGRSESSEMTFVIGRSDPNDTFVALYEDERGVCREFAMRFDEEHWTLSREDPDMHQRFLADVEGDRVFGRWEASDDEGATWRKDFDLTFERSA
ncbi:hypothetical protein [Cryptosporangium phraense]|uniref:DUF1579 domain-containing protein n=1 Tax=Cryptosporangium phraense TaxID=2593070 RepID=A0A545AIF0_9ACTN|nr:hypothetical protein [Cryptosporangium phraense]TQS41096.1 hypothetical protein FL583_31545 [Cryptosporangium phraense]